MISGKDIEMALQHDEDTQKGISTYNKMDTRAVAIAQEITKAMIDNIVKEENDFNLSLAILSISKSLVQLTSFMYDTEEEFLQAMQKARQCIVSDMIPALLDPQPCGNCEECKNGNPDECLNPVVRADYTQSRFLPLICGNLIEYDLFNKVLYMHTVQKESVDVASERKEG